MCEFIVESLEEYEEVVSSSQRLCVVFSAEFDKKSVKFSDAVEELESSAGLADKINFLYLDLSEEDVEAFALDDLGVKSPSTVLLYRGGAKVSTMENATVDKLRPALDALLQDPAPLPPPATAAAAACPVAPSGAAAAAASYMREQQATMTAAELEAIRDMYAATVTEGGVTALGGTAGGCCGTEDRDFFELSKQVGYTEAQMRMTLASKVGR